MAGLPAQMPIGRATSWQNTLGGFNREPQQNYPVVQNLAQKNTPDYVQLIGPHGAQGTPSATKSMSTFPDNFLNPTFLGTHFINNPVLESEKVGFHFLPALRTDSISFSWMEIEYNDSIMMLTPHLSVPREVTMQSTHRKAYIQRVGKSITMELSHMQTPQGQEDFMRKAAAVTASWMAYLFASQMIALTDSAAYYRSWGEKDRLTLEEFEIGLERQKETFAMFNKKQRGWPINALRSQVDRILQQRGVTSPASMMLPRGAISIASASKAITQTAYSGTIAKPPSKSEAMMGAGSIVESFPIRDGNEVSVDYAFCEATEGGYALMNTQEDAHDRAGANYTTAGCEIGIISARQLDYARIHLYEAATKSGLLDQDILERLHQHGLFDVTGRRPQTVGEHLRMLGKLQTFQAILAAKQIPAESLIPFITGFQAIGARLKTPGGAGIRLNPAFASNTLRKGSKFKVNDGAQEEEILLSKAVIRSLNQADATSLQTASEHFFGFRQRLGGLVRHLQVSIDENVDRVFNELWWRNAVGDFAKIDTAASDGKLRAIVAEFVIGALVRLWALAVAKKQAGIFLGFLIHITKHGPAYARFAKELLGNGFNGTVAYPDPTQNRTPILAGDRYEEAKGGFSDFKSAGTTVTKTSNSDYPMYRGFEIPDDDGLVDAANAARADTSPDPDADEVKDRANINEIYVDDGSDPATRAARRRRVMHPGAEFDAKERQDFKLDHIDVTNPQFYKWCIESDLPIYVAFMVARPHKTWRAGMAIAAVPGSKDGMSGVGNTLYGKANVTHAVDGARQEMKWVVTAYGSAVVKNHRELVHVRNVLITDYGHGEGTKFADFSDYRDKGRFMFSDPNFVADGFFAAIPYTFRRDKNYIDALGQLNSRRVHDTELHYPTAPVYRELLGDPKDKEDSAATDYHAVRDARNARVMLKEHYVSQNQLTNKPVWHVNTGVWGPNMYPSNLPARCGKEPIQIPAYLALNTWTMSE